jgi:hypothetical protein
MSAAWPTARPGRERSQGRLYAGLINGDRVMCENRPFDNLPGSLEGVHRVNTPDVRADRPDR